MKILGRRLIYPCSTCGCRTVTFRGLMRHYRNAHRAEVDEMSRRRTEFYAANPPTR